MMRNAIRYDIIQQFYKFIYLDFSELRRTYTLHVI